MVTATKREHIITDNYAERIWAICELDNNGNVSLVRWCKLTGDTDTVILTQREAMELAAFIYKEGNL